MSANLFRRSIPRLDADGVEGVVVVDGGGEAVDDFEADGVGLHLGLVERATDGEGPDGVGVEQLLAVGQPGLVEGGGFAAGVVELLQVAAQQLFFPVAAVVGFAGPSRPGRRNLGPSRPAG